MRDLFIGNHTFRQLPPSAEKIPANILASRLRRLETSGLIRRELCQERSRRYACYLTQKGLDPEPVIQNRLERF
ncbi:MAG: winged helix-turn-helix transcriptional regulator [Gammaproteobacteria bacterium]|nr:winged helix-turn-helix transcriptional regulator [Gammaproteobacteria bacterium]